MVSLLEAESLLIPEKYVVAEIPTVFCDCDGVLADFHGTCRDLLNLATNEAVEDYLNHPTGWNKMRTNHPHVFAIEKKLSDATRLIDELVSLRDNQLIRLKILTALPNSWMDVAGIRESATIDKKHWVNKHFPSIQESDVIVCYRKDKSAFGMADKLLNRVDPILIDDYNKNVVEWVSHTRGYAIEHKSAIDTITQLKIYLKGLRIGATMADISSPKLSVEFVSRGGLSTDIVLTSEGLSKKVKVNKKDKPTAEVQKKGNAPKDPQPSIISKEPETKIIGIDHKGEEVLSNKRDIPKGKGENPLYNPNNDNDSDGPVPASVSKEKITLILHPPVTLKNVVNKDRIGNKLKS